MTMKAIDLYAGIGGWGVGLKLADIEVVAAYEWWSPAADTYRRNLGDHVHQLDLRNLELDSLPDDIDFVVGSPPCTEFSFSNRGGSGDLSEGLKDIEAFLKVVRHSQPKYWVMENVPRVSKVLREALQEGGQLAEYRDVAEGISIDVFDMSEFGLPQRRRRCVAGRYPRDILLSYTKACATRTLGDVVGKLNGKRPTDPIFKHVSERPLTDHQLEQPLNSEEVRMNREAKTFHPVYNNMPFDPAPVIPPFLSRVRSGFALCGP